MLPKAEEQPETSNIEDPDRPTPPGVVVIPIMPQQPHTDTTALFQSSGLIRNKAALTAIGDSCGCMEYGYTRSPALFCVLLCCVMPCCIMLCIIVMSLSCHAVLDPVLFTSRLSLLASVPLSHLSSDLSQSDTSVSLGKSFDRFANSFSSF